MGVSKESINKFLIENRFHLKLRILSPENCKQSLRVKNWKAEVTAEKKQTQDHNQNFVTQAQNHNILANWLMSRMLVGQKSWLMKFNLFVCEQTRSPWYEHTHSAERRLIKTDKTERSTRHWSRWNKCLLVVQGIEAGEISVYSKNTFTQINKRLKHLTSWC